jgi:hypothetical protein
MEALACHPLGRVNQTISKSRSNTKAKARHYQS